MQVQLTLLVERTSSLRAPLLCLAVLHIPCLRERLHPYSECCTVPGARSRRNNITDGRPSNADDFTALAGRRWHKLHSPARLGPQ